MAKSQQTFSKKEKEKKRLKKKQDKLAKREERKQNAKDGSLESMMAYVDEFGNITDTPPDPRLRKKVKAESIEISIPKKEIDVSDPIKRGKVDYYDNSKGFGFIIEQDTQEKYFFHINGVLEDEIGENDKVSFELEKGLKGLNAVRVKKV